MNEKSNSSLVTSLSLARLFHDTVSPDTENLIQTDSTPLGEEHDSEGEVVHNQAIEFDFNHAFANINFANTLSVLFWSVFAIGDIRI